MIYFRCYAKYRVTKCNEIDVIKRIHFDLCRGSCALLAHARLFPCFPNFYVYIVYVAWHVGIATKSGPYSRRAAKTLFHRAALFAPFEISTFYLGCSEIAYN